MNKTDEGITSMDKKFSAYERAKRMIRLKNAQDQIIDEDLINDDLDDEIMIITEATSKPDLVDLTKIGAGVVIGGGIGLLGGVAAIAVSAGVAEVIIGGVVTKIAGVVGGAAGLGWGVHTMDKRKRVSSKGV